MKTNLYIDGFNLYYRALKDTQFRWLDLGKLGVTLFPKDDIHRVCYFTAQLDARPSNPNQPRRQDHQTRKLVMLTTGKRSSCPRHITKTEMKRND
ncbi:MAG: NYN domain-containing protein [Acidimicrobiia bacterium]|nr:NYN domain-containing protein [Acidimicrobiia bacterium]MYG59058.1 NYN domain-containing protein [Acidimicrobiia bacterium]MYJ33192.1 NYN domain-containing protein [Acidimicrobiia bacterium]